MGMNPEVMYGARSEYPRYFSNKRSLWKLVFQIHPDIQETKSQLHS